MKINKKIINQCISILMLVIYLFGSSSILSSHNHDDDNHHHHHHQNLLVCENLNGNSFSNSDCSHESHIITAEEICPLCDYFSNSKLAILDIVINAVAESFNVNEVQLFTSLYLIDANNTRNKSPPFII